ncbi:hypothetical protein I4U23_001096 [Adineta vaga]|nr:hypothetical protein I4U23_001096 [Adineta vaga]
MSGSLISTFSHQRLISPNYVDGKSSTNRFLRETSDISTKDIRFPQLLEKDGGVEEQTVMQVEFINEQLLRKARRSELASKKKCLTRRWQIALALGTILVALAAGIGGLAYWISLPKVITQPFLLYNEECYMNSRSCDATRMLWCPAGKCICIGNFKWNTTAQNCSCGLFETWTGLTCQGDGYFGDPCNTIPCRPTLTCLTTVNQKYTTGQDICTCDNTTYLDTSGGVNHGNCVPRLTYNSPCKSKYDCQDWLGLSCANVAGTARCVCDSTTYWDGVTCAQKALGGESCNLTKPCDPLRGLSCQSGICVCDFYSYWDNITTFWCEQKKTYSISCQYDFQCNTTVNLSCPSVSTGCDCYVTSYAYICDCQAGNFWDGQRCIIRHSFNGTCPGQYACSSNLVCHLGHCICPGNMVWNNPTPNNCDCANGTVWNNTINSCV